MEFHRCYSRSSAVWLPLPQTWFGLRWLISEAATADSEEGEPPPAPSQTVYVEVKTTTTSDKALFEITCGELDFMRRRQDSGSSFELCRVWAAGTPSARVARLREPAAALASGQLTLLIGATDGRHGGESKRQRVE